MLRRVIQPVVLFGVLLTVTLAGGNIGFVSLNARLLLVTILVLAALVNLVTLRDGSSASEVGWGWLLLGLVTFISLWQADFRRGIEMWLFPLGLQVPCFFAATALMRRHWKIQYWLRALLLTGFILFIQTGVLLVTYLLSWRGYLPPGSLFPPIEFRINGVLDNPNVYGAFLAMVIPAAVGYGIASRTLERLLTVVWLIMALGCLLATGSRGALIATSIGVGAAVLLTIVSSTDRSQRLVTWLAAERRRRRIIALSGVGVALLLIGIIVYQSAAPGRANAVERRFTLLQVALDAGLGHPGLGTGTGTYPVELMRQVSIPPVVIERHAHNLFLNIFAEDGLPGLAALMLLITLTVRSGSAVWSAASTDHRMLLSGVIGGLIAFLVSGLADNPMAQAAPFFVATIFCALLTAEQKPSTTRRLSPFLITVISILICALGIGLTILYLPLWTGAHEVEALRNNNQSWIASAQTLDKGIQTDPFDPLIRLQSAVAWARAAYSDTESGALDQAVQRYREAVQLDPTYAVHHLNLGILLNHQDTSAALTELAVAARQAPDSAVMHLNYGIALEAAQQPEAARLEYSKTLMLNETWRAALFWQQTPLRREVWQVASTAGTDAHQRFLALLSSGDAARAAGNVGAAVAAYEVGLGQVSERSDQLLARALAAWAKGDTDSARYDLRVVTALDGEDIARAWLYMGDLAGSEGDLHAMIADYQIAFSRLDSYSAFGPGTFGEITYAVNVFGRYGYVSDYLPDVMLLDIGPFEAGRFVILAQGHIASGEVAYGSHIYRRILLSNPGYAPAQSALNALGSRP